MNSAAPAQELVELPEPQQKRLECYLDRLLAANQHINLTALRNRDDAMDRHIVESVRVANIIGCPPNLIDVGSGGGLPGLVLAIVRPQTQVTLLEATEKKARFLEQTASELGLSNLTVVRARAEEAGRIGQPLREHFAYAVARAVAALPTLLELTLPFVAPKGSFLAIKGQRASEELAASENALSVLRAEIASTIRQPSATLLLFHKTGRLAAQFPRKTGEPKRNPL